MKKHIYIYSLIIIGIIIIGYGCKKEDPFEKDNITPVVEIEYTNKNGKVFYTKKDSINDTLKIENSIELRFYVENGSENNLRYNLEYEGYDEDKIEDKNYILDIYIENETTGNIRFETDKEGSYRFVFENEDKFGEIGKAILILEVIENLIPVANMEITKLDEISKYEIEVDATGSYDPDERYGGGIEKYEYIIGDYKLVTDKDKIKYIVPERGDDKKTDVKLRVKDNQDKWSEELIKELNF